MIQLIPFVLLFLLSIASDPGPSPTLGAEPPDLDDDKTVILFDGTSWDQWTNKSGEPSQWNVLDDGSIEVKPRTGDARTAAEFGDFQLHLEFRVPDMPHASGQGKGNSGVYLHGRYEVQILDSFGLDSQDNDCGAIYKVSKPLVNVCRPPLEWQTYDIVFRAPRIDEEGNITENPRITVLHNGVAIQNNVEVLNPTGAAMYAQTITATGPIVLQDHGNLLRFRNIWLRKLD